MASEDKRGGATQWRQVGRGFDPKYGNEDDDEAADKLVDGNSDVDEADHGEHGAKHVRARWRGEDEPHACANFGERVPREELRRMYWPSASRRQRAPGLR